MNENESFFDELKKDVDADHRRIDGADAPPSNMWNSIRAQTKPETNEERKMIASNLMSHAPTPVATPVARQQSGVRHTLSLAASFLIVMSVALAGWFATMQLNQSGGSRGYFGLFGQSDQSATCDVEPLTVDEVIAIVENPYSVAPLDTWGTPQPGQEDNGSLAGEGYREAGFMVGMPESLSEVPDEQEFHRIQSATNSYLNCIQTGTVGQVMALTHPETLQSNILSRFPVYRDQAEVRAMVEESIDRPFFVPSDPQALDVPPNFQTTFATPDRFRVRIGAPQSHSLLAEQVAWVGLDMKDENGVVIGKSDWDATILEGDLQSNNGGYSVILVYSEATDTWYYYGMHAPRG